MTKLDDVIPEKGKDLKVICSDNNCKSFRDSINGSDLLIDVIYWKYE